MTRSTSTRTAALLLTCLAAACTGAIVDPDERGSDTPVPGGSTPLSCDASGGPSAGVAPLRRLTRLEYDNTVRDLLGDESAPAQAFIADEAVAGFDANSVASISKQQTEDFLDAASVLAKTAVDTRLDALVGCDVTEDACAQSFIASFGRRAFRRPLDEVEHSDLFGIYSQSRALWDAKTGIELVIRSLLSSSSFLYLVETFAPGQSGAQAQRVDAYTLASRLSYFFWGSMPDDTLFEAADAGTLDTVEGIDAQARRLLADPRSEQTVASFHTQWLGIANLGEVTKDAALFPEYDADLAASMQEETRRFTSHVVLQGDARLSTLLTASHSFVDAPLAKLYGAAPPSAAFERTELDPSERAGVLTHASVMTAQSHATETSWVLRGKLIREQFLCDTLGTPPDGAEMTATKNLGRLEDPGCKGCHLKMDPIGFGFDAYSPVGAYRTVDEHGETVSTAGEIVELDLEVDAAGKFDGAVELAHALASSEDVGRCVTRQWFRYATRRMETDRDGCSVASLQADFAESGHDIRELMIAISKTDSFRYRAVTK